MLIEVTTNIVPEDVCGFVAEYMDVSNIVREDECIIVAGQVDVTLTPTSLANFL